MGQQGRGDGRVLRPSKTPTVTIGLTLSTSSPTLDPSSTNPFYLIITARILTTPKPSLPITIATHLTPFSPLPNKAFTDIICINPRPGISQKQIKIFEPNWPHYIFESSDKKDDWDFVTIPGSNPNMGPHSSLPSTRVLVAKHEIPISLIEAAGVDEGERYRVSFTDKCLGTLWWMFGDLKNEEMKDVRVVTRGRGQDVPNEGTDGEGRWFKGEMPEDLALVIEHENEGVVEFDII